MLVKSSVMYKVDWKPGLGAGMYTSKHLCNVGRFMQDVSELGSLWLSRIDTNQLFHLLQPSWAQLVKISAAFSGEKPCPHHEGLKHMPCQLRELDLTLLLFSISILLLTIGIHKVAHYNSADEPAHHEVE